MKTRKAPNIKLSPIPKDFGVLLVHEFDWWQEALNLSIPDVFWKRLKELKATAVENDDRRMTPISCDLDEVPFQLQPRGAPGGKEFVLDSEHFRIELGAPKRQWTVSWRAKSAALWGVGVHELRKRMYSMLRAEGFLPNDRDDYIRLSRVDYCFDIESAAFTDQMVPAIATQTVCPKQTKVRGDFVVQADRLETLTIGMGSTCQVQIYNKTKEITDASNKTWLYDVWDYDGGKEAEIDPETGEILSKVWANVWRVEVRLRKDWLKDRKVKSYN